MKYFSIPEPCSENWNEMTATEKGAFCRKCSNEVHDVSEMSNDEIIQLISSEKKVPCMRMTTTQERSLNVDFQLMHQSQKRNMQRAMLFSLLVVFGFTLFSCNDSQQIHERNLLESAAKSILVSAEETKSEAETIIQLENLERDVQDNVIKVSELDLVEPVETLEREYHLLGEPAIQYDNLVEEKKELKVIEVDEQHTHTMGKMVMVQTIEPRELLVQVKEDNNLPKELTALTYPNPATTNTTLKVELPDATDNLGIRLLDMNGRILKEINNKAADPGVHEFRIELLDLNPAYYLIDVRYNDQHKVVRVSKI